MFRVLGWARWNRSLTLVATSSRWITFSSRAVYPVRALSSMKIWPRNRHSPGAPPRPEGPGGESSWTKSSMAEGTRNSWVTTWTSWTRALYCRRRVTSCGNRTNRPEAHPWHPGWWASRSRAGWSTSSEEAAGTPYRSRRGGPLALTVAPPRPR